jgi:class 3 adenylate cyclase/tetratricopeptide (TPR) repeat protein/ribosomal protein L40E
MRCSKCGTSNPSTNNFCAKCGSSLAKLCGKCKAENPPTSDFCGKCGTPLTKGAGAAAAISAPLELSSKLRVAPESSSPQALEGERKMVTALFADIKGSTELEQDLDPEEARAIIDPALKLMIDAVRRYDGYIVQSTGDGIFALFGAPVAHEDHPQRALYAALRMQEDLKRYAARLREAGNLPIEARVGVNTGEVVVRSITTGEGQTEYTPIGHTTNLASRMQALAPTGSIATSEQTRKFVEGYFQLKPLGPTKVKGVSEPVNVYEVTGLGPLRTRLQRSAGRGFTKFVGRAHEMDALKHAADQARAGHGQIVAAMAEAGVGKSRLLFEFKAVSQSGWMVLETFSVSHGKASAFLPVIDLLHGYFKITGDDDLRARRVKVNGTVLTLDRALEDTLPYLFGLLGIVEGVDPLAQMDAQVRTRRTLDAIKRILIRESLNQPLMVVFEDLHWIDDETQAFLNLLADSIATTRILLLVNYRPEYSHQWNSKTNYTQLLLDPLGKESAEEMLSALLGDGKDLAPLKRLIIERTEGNPFFMEETVLVLFDEGALKRNGAVKLTQPLSQLKIPPTVQAILASRIDRLAPDHKELLQTLAVIGMEFQLDLVRKVLEVQSGLELESMLSELHLGEFIYEQPAAGDIAYTFKHALTHDVAYNSVLNERRKAMHERIGSAMEEQFAGRLEDHLGDLARHYSRSGNNAKAIEYLHRAAYQAAQRSSYPEAIAYVNNALEILAGLPHSEQRDRDELLLRAVLGVSLMAAKGFDSDEIERSFARGAVLARELKDTIFLFNMLNGLWGFHFSRGHVKPAVDFSREMMAVAEQLNDPGSIRDAHGAIGSSLVYTGDLVAARRHLEQAAAALTSAQRSMRRPNRFGPDPRVLALTGLGDVLFDLGYSDQALNRAYEAMGVVDVDSEPFSFAMAMVFVAQIHCARGEAVKGEESARAALALSEQHGYPFWHSVGIRILGWALMLQGQVREGLDLVEEEMLRFTGPRAEMVNLRVLLNIAEGYELLGEAQRAAVLLDQWNTVRDKLELGMLDSFYYRMRGRVFLRSGADDEAEKAFRQAIEAAVARNAKSEELRSTVLLAQVLTRHEHRDEARAMLAEIYNWFTEGFDTARLKEAKALLDELNA